jgi:methyl-accepting chemotaxis protein
MVDGLNRLMQTTELNLGEVSSMLRAIADGRLGARMHGDFQGVFARIAGDANTTAAQLATIVTDIKHASGNIHTPPRRSPPATMTCRAAPSSRPPTWKRRRHRWRN